MTTGSAVEVTLVKVTGPPHGVSTAWTLAVKPDLVVVESEKNLTQMVLPDETT